MCRKGPMCTAFSRGLHGFFFWQLNTRKIEVGEQSYILVWPQVLVDRTQHPLFFHFYLFFFFSFSWLRNIAVFWLHKSTDMYIEMPFSDCISRLICIYREGISLPHNFHENYATCSGNPMSKSIKMHLPLSWLARFVSANIPFLKRTTFFTKIFLWNKKSDELYIVSTVLDF